MKILLVISLTIILASNVSRASSQNASDTTGLYNVYVIQSRWHTGIVFYTRHVNPGYWPEIRQYDNRVHVEVGWGDEKFYQSTRNLVFLAIRAMLWPTPSVLQVHGFSRPVTTSYGQGARILMIPLDEVAHDALTRFVGESYLRDAKGQSQRSTLFGESAIYFRATRKYHLFQTCNTWVALAFRVAGKNIRSFGVLNANQLFGQLSRIDGARFK